MNVRVSLAALALVAGACLLTGAELVCASAESMDGLMAAWTRGYNARSPAVTARVALRGKFSADFIDPLARGEVQVAPFARELFANELTRFAALAGGAPRAVPVATGSRATKGGTHAIVLFVHERNPLTQLTLDQVRGIYDGTLTTWGQLGLTGVWQDRRILTHGMRSRRETGNPPGIVNYLEQRLLAGRSWRADLHEHSDIPGGDQALAQIVTAVAADEAAIGYSGFAYARPGVKPIALGDSEAGPFYAGTEAEIAARRYPLSRTLYLVTQTDADAATRAFVDYVLSPEGQAAISADTQGFFPLPTYHPEPVTVPAGAGYVTPEGAVAVVGYNDMREMMEALTARFSALHPGIRFSLDLRGTKTAPSALARGRSAFAPMGADLTPPQLADYHAVAKGDPLAIRVAHCSMDPRALSGPLAVIVHADNPLESLTLAEVADIFAGRSRRGLHLTGMAPDTALGLDFCGRVLGGQSFAPDYRGWPQSAAVVRAVAADPQAIGFAAAMRATPGVKALALAARPGAAPVRPEPATIAAGTYPLDRFLLIQARRPLDPFVRECLRFMLSEEGQGIIARGTLGYAPLTPVERAIERAKLD